MAFIITVSLPQSILLLFWLLLSGLSINISLSVDDTGRPVHR